MARWYNAQGESFECDVRRARKENLFPSVTTVLRLLDKPMLNKWKVDNAIKCALNTPREENESDEDYFTRIDIESDKISATAMNIGTAVHKHIENFYTKEGFYEANENQKGNEVFLGIRDRLSERILLGQCETSIINENLGYAGRLDFTGTDSDGNEIIADFKTQATREKKAITKYPEWLWQLGAYSMGSDSKLVSVVISTTEIGRIDFVEYTEEQKKKAQEQFTMILNLFKSLKGL